MTSARLLGRREHAGLPVKNRVTSPAAEAIGMILAVVAGGVVLAFALWYTSSGRFPEFPNIQNDYVDLGRAFLEGQLSLLEQPDPRLAELGNPYEYTQRKGLPYHWDASYYDEKYYLYWGPAPALVSAGLQLLTGTPPSASLLVVLPFIGLIIVAIALLWILAGSFGRPGRMSVWLFIVALFINLPMLVTLGQPRHYQSSILFGQFFLLLGMLGAAQHIRGRSAWWLSMAGLAWGLAIASRYNLAISLAIYCACIGAWFWKDGSQSLWRRSALLLVPAALCLSGLGLYNLARFGDPLESGMSYQFTIPEFHQVSYSVSYAPSGLYVYLLHPLDGASAFPFMQPPHFRPALMPPSIYVPDGRAYDQVILGLIPTVPAIWLGALVLPLAGIRLKSKLGRAVRSSIGVWPGIVFAMLAAGAVGQFIFLLLFFYVAQRYLVDFYVPVLICLSGLTWYAEAALSDRPQVRLTVWILVAVLILWTAAIGYFGCFGVPVLVSSHYNPRMLADLAAFWNGGSGLLRYLVPAIR